MPAMLPWNFEGEASEPAQDPTMAPHKRQSYEEELANAITHGVGLVLSLIGWVGLLVLSGLAGGGWDLAASAVFGGTLVFLYATSTLYHSVGTARLKRTLRILDHVAIFLLIAGTYTPFAGVLMREGWGWSVLALVWGIALAGLLFKLFSTHRFHPAATTLYLLMGWLGVLFADPMSAALPLGGTAPHRGRRAGLHDRGALLRVALPALQPCDLARLRAGGERVPLRRGRAVRPVAPRLVAPRYHAYVPSSAPRSVWGKTWRASRRAVLLSPGGR